MILTSVYQFVKKIIINESSLKFRFSGSLTLVSKIKISLKIKKNRPTKSKRGLKIDIFSIFSQGFHSVIQS